MKQLVKENKIWRKAGWICKLLLMVYALTPGSLAARNGSLDGLHMGLAFLAMGLGVVLWITREELLRKNNWLRFMCGFLAFTTVLGASYHELGSWDYLFGSFAQFLLALAVMAGYYWLYNSLIVMVAYIAGHREEIRRREARGTLEQFLFEKHPFEAAFCFAMICALPYVICFYPGLIQADAFEQLWKYMGILENSNHHPVVSTAVMGKCLAIGRTVLGSDNLGIFLYTIMQSLLQWAGIAYLICILKKMKAPIWIRWFGLLFLTVLPLFPMWGFTMAKDTQYYLCLLYFGLSVADLLLEDTKKRKYCEQIVFCCASYGMILSRKEGRYVLAASLLCLLIYHRKQWKLYVFTAVTCFMILFAVEQVYLPAHNMTNGRIAEALSVPIQQTARYQRDHGAEVTPYEREVLSEIFEDYDNMGTQHYGPEVSDGAKAQMISDPTKEQLENYLKVWFAQFCKHPDTYLQAFINQTYGYFYTDRKEYFETPVVETLIGRERLPMEEFYMEVSFWPQLKGGRTFLIGLVHLTVQFPLISLLYNAGFHGYLLVGCIVYLLASKKRKRILLLTPTILVFLVCLFSPVNGYIRYMLPVMMMLPLNLAWCAYDGKESVTKKEEK